MRKDIKVSVFALYVLFLSQSMSYPYHPYAGIFCKNACTGDFDQCKTTMFTVSGFQQCVEERSKCIAACGSAAKRDFQLYADKEEIGDGFILEKK